MQKIKIQETIYDVVFKNTETPKETTQMLKLVSWINYIWKQNGFNLNLHIHSKALKKFRNAQGSYLSNIQKLLDWKILNKRNHSYLATKDSLDQKGFTKEIILNNVFFDKKFVEVECYKKRVNKKKTKKHNIEYLKVNKINFRASEMLKIFIAKFSWLESLNDEARVFEQVASQSRKKFQGLIKMIQSAASEKGKANDPTFIRWIKSLQQLSTLLKTQLVRTFQVNDQKRKYSFLTNMPSEMRQVLRYDDAKIIELDLKSSQVLFLMREYILASETCENHLLDYFEGDFYQNLQVAIANWKPFAKVASMSREKFKKYFFVHIIYSQKFEGWNIINKFLKIHHANFYHFLKSLKIRVSSSQLAIHLQNQEAFLINHLSQQFNCLSVFDSLLIPNYKYLLKALQKAFWEFTNWHFPQITLYMKLQIK